MHVDTTRCVAATQFGSVLLFYVAQDDGRHPGWMAVDACGEGMRGLGEPSRPGRTASAWPGRASLPASCYVNMSKGKFCFDAGFALFCARA